MTKTDHYLYTETSYTDRYYVPLCTGIIFILWLAFWNYFGIFNQSIEVEGYPFFYHTVVTIPAVMLIVSNILIYLIQNPPEREYAWKSKPIIIKDRSLCGRKAVILTEDEEIIYGDEKVYFAFTIGSKYKVSLDSNNNIGEYKRSL